MQEIYGHSAIEMSRARWKRTIEQVTWTYMLAVLILVGFCIDLASAQVCVYLCTGMCVCVCVCVRMPRVYIMEAPCDHNRWPGRLRIPVACPGPQVAPGVLGRPKTPGVDMVHILNSDLARLG